MRGIAMNRRRPVARALVVARRAPVTRDQWAVRLAALTLSLLCAALLAGRAVAGDGAAAATPAAPASSTAASTVAATSSVQVPLVTQDALLARQAKKDPQLFVLDVRTPQEYAEGHVPGAVNVPHDQVASRLAEVPKDKDVVIYCRSGRRAALAAEVLEAQGYSRLSHLEGDMNAWVEKGRPVEK
jgi:rhodanese-related sulfurtransferase